MASTCDHEMRNHLTFAVKDTVNNNLIKLLFYAFGIRYNQGGIIGET